MRYTFWIALAAVLLTDLLIAVLLSLEMTYPNHKGE